MSFDAKNGSVAKQLEKVYATEPNNNALNERGLYLAQSFRAPVTFLTNNSKAFNSLNARTVTTPIVSMAQEPRDFLNIREPAYVINARRNVAQDGYPLQAMPGGVRDYQIGIDRLNSERNYIIHRAAESERKINAERSAEANRVDHTERQRQQAADIEAAELEAEKAFVNQLIRENNEAIRQQANVERPLIGGEVGEQGIPENVVANDSYSIPDGFFEPPESGSEFVREGVKVVPVEQQIEQKSDAVKAEQGHAEEFVKNPENNVENIEVMSETEVFVKEMAPELTRLSDLISQYKTLPLGKQKELYAQAVSVLDIIGKRYQYHRYLTKEGVNAKAERDLNQSLFDYYRDIRTYALIYNIRRPDIYDTVMDEVVDFVISQTPEYATLRHSVLIMDKYRIALSKVNSTPEARSTEQPDRTPDFPDATRFETKPTEEPNYDRHEAKYPEEPMYNRNYTRHRFGKPDLNTHPTKDAGKPVNEKMSFSDHFRSYIDETKENGTPGKETRRNVTRDTRPFSVRQSDVTNKVDRDRRRRETFPPVRRSRQQYEPQGSIDPSIAERLSKRSAVETPLGDIALGPILPTLYTHAQRVGLTGGAQSLPIDEFKKFFPTQGGLIFDVQGIGLENVSNPDQFLIETHYRDIIAQPSASEILPYYVAIKEGGIDGVRAIEEQLHGELPQQKLRAMIMTLYAIMALNLQGDKRVTPESSLGTPSVPSTASMEVDEQNLSPVDLQSDDSDATIASIESDSANDAPINPTDSIAIRQRKIIREIGKRRESLENSLREIFSGSKFKFQSTSSFADWVVGAMQEIPGLRNIFDGDQATQHEEVVKILRYGRKKWRHKIKFGNKHTPGAWINSFIRTAIALTDKAPPSSSADELSGSEFVERRQEPRLRPMNIDDEDQIQ